jgi:WD40 repeat protein
VFHSLGPEEQRVARRIFLSLTELGEPNDAEGLPAPDSRRQARLEELLPDRGNPNLVRGVLATLVEARLITVGKGMVDVAHEALIREWPSLRGWLTEDRDDLVYRQQLREDAQAWSELDRSVDLLYRGARLSGALEWVAQHSEGGMPLEREFLAASESEHQAQQARELQAAQDQAERERRNARRLRRFAIVLSLATLAAGALAGVAVYFGRLAQQQRAVSTSRELAAAAISQLQEDPELSVLLALEALEESETREAEVALHRAVFASRVEATLGGHQGPVRAALYSPDGDRIVTADEAGTVWIWSSQDWQPVSSWTGHPAPINGLAFSPDGRRLATSGEDEQVKLWNADTAELLQTLSGGGGPVAFSPDGRWLVASQADRSVRLWDLDTGAVARQLEGHQDLVISLTFSADSTRLATAGWDAQLIFWEVNTGRRLQSWEGEFGDLVFHPEDDRLFADFSAGGKILRLPDGEEQVSTGGHTNLVLAGAIDGGWTRIATSGLDRKIVVSDAQSGEQILILGGHAAQVADLAFSPDGRHLVSASGDGSARVWDLAPAREVLTIETLDGYGRIAFSPDGARIAAGDADTIGVWDSVSGAALQRFSQPTLTTGVAFAPDLPWLAGATEGGRLTIWNVDTGDTLWTAEVSEALIFFLAFSPDGRRLAAASEDGHVRVFAADAAALVLDLDLQAPVLSVAFSPVGSQLLTTDFDHNAILWDAESGRRLVTMQHDDLVWGGAFSPDGLRIATASTDGTARIWEAATGSELHRLIGHSSTVVSVAFTPDGSRLATVGRDGTARLWDAETGERLLSLEGEGEGLNGVAVSPDGARLATAGARAIRFYYLSLSDLQELARDRVTRGLTDEECRVYLHQSGCLP